jgi:hypothetical protein
MEQFLRFDGVTNSNKTRKDDAVDCTAILVDHCLPKTIEETPLPDPDKQKEREDEAEREENRERIRMQHAAMFGNETIPYQKKPADELPEQKSKQTDPRLAQLAKCLPSGFRL